MRDSCWEGESLIPRWVGRGRVAVVAMGWDGDGDGDVDVDGKGEVLREM